MLRIPNILLHNCVTVDKYKKLKLQIVVGGA